jgi:hypothetical protein
MHRELAPLSIDELQARLCDLECITPNFILLELKCRGVNIDEFLPVVLALLESDRSDRRTTGYAAFLSAFSQYSALLPKYNPFNETAECQAKVAVLREALTEHPSPLPPPTDN